MALVDLPEIQFVDDDVTATLNNVLTIHAVITGRTLAPADPERLFLLSLCTLIVQQRTLINQTTKATMLRYAPGPTLDHMGAFAETARLPDSAAKTTMRYILSAPQISAVSIPTGSRVTIQGDPKRYFATSEYAEVAAGQTTVDIPAVCTELGELGNGYIPGQINQIVDPIAFVASASNLTESSGGADIESDDAYRERIHTAPESFSVAGPSGAYEYWAKTASALIVDVSVDSPAPCEVVVVPLLVGGEIPGTEILDAVESILSDSRIRPLTDQVTVSAPTAVSYDITITYYIDRARAAEVTAIQTAVTQAVADYVLWQKSKLGRDVNPSELIRRVMTAGSYRTDITSPINTTLGLGEVAVANVINITYGGLTDD